MHAQLLAAAIRVGWQSTCTHLHTRLCWCPRSHVHTLPCRHSGTTPHQCHRRGTLLGGSPYHSHTCFCLPAACCCCCRWLPVCAPGALRKETNDDVYFERVGCGFCCQAGVSWSSTRLQHRCCGLDACYCGLTCYQQHRDPQAWPAYACASRHVDEPSQRVGGPLCLYSLYTSKHAVERVCCMHLLMKRSYIWASAWGREVGAEYPLPTRAFDRDASDVYNRDSCMMVLRRRLALGLAG